METSVEQVLIDSREALLDAVEALSSHSDAIILVGAQAVYAHTENRVASVTVSPFTYDADIVLDPDLLATNPTIIDAMRSAGFELGTQPGLYKRDGQSQVDLLVPEFVGGSGRRGARLGVHGTKAAMKVHGLEGALVSHSRKEIISLLPRADRSCSLKVAGPAALLVAKLHKISERVDSADVRRRSRLSKDAFDIYRLLLAIDTVDMASEFGLLRSRKISNQVTSDAR